MSETVHKNKDITITLPGIIINSETKAAVWIEDCKSICTLKTHTGSLPHSKSYRRTRTRAWNINDVVWVNLGQGISIGSTRTDSGVI